MKIVKYSTASFDVDPEKGFTSICPNELPVKDGENIVEELNIQATFARLRIGSKDSHPSNAVWKAETPDQMFQPVLNGGDNVDIQWNMHCASGTKGMELLDGLPTPEQYNFFVWKGIETNLHPYGACYHDLNNKLSTGVIEFLIMNKIQTVILAGLALDYCVKTTALQLKKAGFNVIVNLNGCRGIAQNTIEIALASFKEKGILTVNSTKDFEVVNG